MTVYEKEFLITTTTSPQVVVIDYPGRCTLDRIAAILVAGGTVTVDLFSRAFTGPAVPIYAISNYNNTGVCLIQLSSTLACKVGDPVVVASSPTAGYNTTHRIVTIIDDLNVVTDQNYTVDAIGGTATVTIPAAEQELYRVCPQITGASPQVATPNIPFKNQDAVGNRNIGVKRKMYLKIATAGTYRFAIRSHEGIGMGG